VSPRLRHLLSPGRIGPIALRNRILMAPMGTNFAEPDGQVGERMQRHFEERARGGVGLVVVGVGAVAFPDGACIPNQVAFSDDRFLPGLRALVARVHAHGAKIAIQLQHAGKVALQDVAAGRPLQVPSLVSGPAGDILNDLAPGEIAALTAPYTRPGARLALHEMTKAEIAQLVERFADAADRARRAGFDAIEIHGAHGYLISSFLSPASNRRSDEYGGSLENRARLLCEVIRAVKARVGSELAVWVRLDAKELRIEGGIELEHALRSAELAEAAGADAIHVSAYADPTSGVAFTDAPLVHEPGGFLGYAEAMKRRLRIPVIAVGRIEPEQADAGIRDGRIDFVAMARKLLADPELPRKLAEGRPEDVRPCIYCYTCVSKIFLLERTVCAVNPACGREAELAIEPAKPPRRVVVVGGGPAGMEAARIAALRGHRVTLLEKEERLGGTLFFSSLVYAPNGRLVDWLETQVRKAGVEVRLGAAATLERVRALAPDVVLVATGARRAKPPIPGAERAHVLSGDDLRALLTGSDPEVAREKLSLLERAVVGAGWLVGATSNAALLREATRRWMPLGKRVVIVGGGLVGIELAEFLCERGRSVTVLEESATLGAEMALPRRWRALFELRAHGATLVTRARVEAIEEGGVAFVDATGRRSVAPADHVILALGAREDRSLAAALQGVAPQVIPLGDCDGVGYVEGAMRAAARVAQGL
jgi:2,4-dienoyl-CoA reductase (NADPH2)